jgi:predicted nucleic acid-binding protein
VIVVDTSVTVAAFASWHDHHKAAVAALQRAPRLPAPVATETYSVLTRLPAPHRAPATLVRQFLSDNFASQWLVIDGLQLAKLLSELVGLGIIGGSTYDALVGAVARAHGATLLTLDERARPTYTRLGVAVEYLGPLAGG